MASEIELTPQKLPDNVKSISTDDLSVILLLAVPRRLFCFGSLMIFRCVVPLFIVIRVIYKYKNR